MNLEINEVFGRPIWLAKKGHGSFLTFEMGDRVSKKSRNGEEYFQGSFHLWVYLCEWEIKQNGILLAHSESSDSEIENSAKKFEGLSFRSVNFNAEKVVVFEAASEQGELSLVLKANTSFYDLVDDLFILFTPKGSLSYNLANGLEVEVD